MRVLTVKAILENDIFKPVVLVDETREIKGAYCGDLLSWVMGRAEEDNAFVTIMTNVNVLAVASLINMSVVIVCENAELSDEFLSAAEDKGINVVKSSLPSYETCVALSKII